MSSPGSRFYYFKLIQKHNVIDIKGKITVCLQRKGKGVLRAWP